MWATGSYLLPEFKLRLLSSYVFSFFVLLSAVFDCFCCVQTYRELLRLSEGVGFRIHIIDKASLAAKKYGPQSNKKYGERQRIISLDVKHANKCCFSSLFKSWVSLCRYPRHHSKQTHLPSQPGSSGCRSQQVVFCPILSTLPYTFMSY